MPHSSGGGSHGGGFHGGGSHGRSNNRVSSHYFAGSRRYRRHYTDGRPDEYVYARRMPNRTSLSSVLIFTFVGALFIFAGIFGIESEFPRKLTPEYIDEPSVYDYIGVIDNADKLQKTLDDYCDTTGICPVIYTVYDEFWNSDYADLEDYTFATYVNYYSDEQHFVIVYSIPMAQAEGVMDGSITVPDYSWEAVQGDDTDPLITESVFEKFGKTVQRKLEAGEGPGEAFDSAFAESTVKLADNINPSGFRKVVSFISAYTPFLIILAIFVPMIFVTIKNYIKDRSVVFEEVPLDAAYINSDSKDNEPRASGINNGYHKRVSLDTEKAGSKLTGVITFAVLIPFFAAGIIMLLAAISMIKSGFKGSFGYTLLGFAVLWLIILILTSFKFIKNIIRIRKKENEPADVSYPTAEYPQPVYPEQNNQTAQTIDQQFDSQFFQQAKSNIEDDDEDYKRMKRQGFE